MAVIQANQAARRSESEILQLEAQLAAAQSRILSTRSQGVANLAAADSDLVDLEQRSSQSLIAPYAGKLSAVYARPGPVQRDDILFVLSSSDTIEAIAVVPEAVAQKLSVGTRAAVNVYGTSSLDMKVSEGTLTEVSSGVVSMSVLGEQQVGHIARISIKRPAFKLSPGTRVSIKLQAKEQRLISWLFPALNY
jgi:multidrug resistance efflux pump